MRTTIKDAAYFSNYRSEITSVIERSKQWIKEGKVPSDRMSIAIDGMRSNYLKLAIAGYSSGATKSEVSQNLLNAIKFLEPGGTDLWKLPDSKGQNYNQYILSAYDEILWMISLGYLLDIPTTDFNKMVTVIDTDGVKDILLEFIISAKVENRAPIDSESYKGPRVIPEIFLTIRQTLSESDKTKATNLINTFLEKDWFQKHKEAAWHNSHKSKHNVFFGYWSFESAAVVKIKGLDDSTFKNNQYYPKDLL
jgi:hypothetical protein